MAHRFLSVIVLVFAVLAILVSPGATAPRYHSARGVRGAAKRVYVPHVVRPQAYHRGHAVRPVHHSAWHRAARAARLHALRLAAQQRAAAAAAAAQRRALQQSHRHHSTHIRPQMPQVDYRARDRAEEERRRQEQLEVERLLQLEAEARRDRERQAELERERRRLQEQLERERRLAEEQKRRDEADRLRRDELERKARATAQYLAELAEKEKRLQKEKEDREAQARLEAERQRSIAATRELLRQQQDEQRRRDNAKEEEKRQVAATTQRATTDFFAGRASEARRFLDDVKKQDLEQAAKADDAKHQAAVKHELKQWEQGVKREEANTTQKAAGVIKDLAKDSGFKATSERLDKASGLLSVYVGTANAYKAYQSGDYPGAALGVAKAAVAAAKLGAKEFPGASGVVSIGESVNATYNATNTADRVAAAGELTAKVVLGGLAATGSGLASAPVAGPAAPVIAAKAFDKAVSGASATTTLGREATLPLFTGPVAKAELRAKDERGAFMQTKAAVARQQHELRRIIASTPAGRELLQKHPPSTAWHREERDRGALRPRGF